MGDTPRIKDEGVLQSNAPLRRCDRDLSHESPSPECRERKKSSPRTLNVEDCAALSLLGELNLIPLKDSKDYSEWNNRTLFFESCKVRSLTSVLRFVSVLGPPYLPYMTSKEEKVWRKSYVLCVLGKSPAYLVGFGGGRVKDFKWLVHQIPRSLLIRLKSQVDHS